MSNFEIVLNKIFCNKNSFYKTFFYNSDPIFRSKYTKNKIKNKTFFSCIIFIF